MATKLADVFINVLVKGDDLDQGLNRAERRTSAFANTLQGVFQGIGQRLFDAVSSGVNAAVGSIGKAIQASSNLNESINKATVVFGENAQAILEWSQTSDKAFGQSQQQALEAAAGFGNLFRSMGLTADEAADMSKALVELAGDLASFNNISPDAALIKLRAGIVGETEPLRTLGVNLSAVAVEAEAMRLGLGNSAQELSQQDKVLARYNIILKQTALAQGDFGRTAQSAANAQRILAAQFENASARLGNVFRPAYESIINLLVDLAPTVFNYAENIAASFANGLASVVRYITPVLLQIKSLLAYWLAPGSPPKLLPDITKWGLGAMQAYLDGFLDADVKGALDSVGRAIGDILRSFVGTGQLTQGDVVQRLLGGRESIAKAVKEFKTLGRVSSETMAAIVRAAGPAGASVAALVRSYFDLESASRDVASAQDELNKITQAYAGIIDPLQGKLTANQSAQQAIEDELKLAQLRSDIADATLEQEQAIAAQQEIAQIRARQAAGGQNWAEREADAARLVELEKQLKAAASATQRTELARLQIDEIRLRQQLQGVEQQKSAEEDAAQKRLDAAKAAQESAQKQLDNAQALISLQQERNQLIGEQIRLEKEAEQARLDAIQKIKDEEERARKEAEQAAEKAQRDQRAVEDAQFDFQFATADTAGKLALLQKKLGETQSGTVDYYRTLTQIAQVQQQYNDELERASKVQDDATEEAKRAADAQFDYQFSIADTAGQLALLRGKLADTTEGSAEYYQTLTQIAALEKQYQAQIKQATDAQFQYQLAIAETPEKIALLQQALAQTTEGSVEYFQILTQISALEKQRQNELAGIADQQAADANQAAEAQFQYQLALADTAGKIDLLKEKLAGQQKGSAEYYQTLTQIQSLESQLADEQKRAAEQSADAFFNYKLAVADTAGQLEILRGKLATLTPGSSEYYQVLTQIAQTQERLNKEQEAGKTSLEGLGAIDIGPGLEAGVNEPIGAATEAGKNLKAAIDEMTKALNQPPTKLPANMQAIVDRVGEVIQAIKDAVGQNEIGAQSWDHYGIIAEANAGKAAQESKKSASGIATDIEAIAAAIRAFTAASHGDWAQFWVELGTLADTFFTTQEGTWARSLAEFLRAVLSWVPLVIQGWIDMFTAIGTALATFGTTVSTGWDTALGGLVAAITAITGDVYNAGLAVVNSVWDGMQAGWGAVDSWFRQKLQDLTDLLPFSEPKDASSPLRGLSKSGEAIVEGIQGGIESASLGVNSLAGGLLAQPMGLALPGGGSVNFGTINVTINGPADEETVRRGVAAGAEDIVRALRQRGL